MTDPAQLVDVRGLTVDFLAGGAPLRAVAGLDLMLHAGEVLALLGESGSGKTVTLRAMMRLLPAKEAHAGFRDDAIGSVAGRHHMRRQRPFACRRAPRH
jgi:ABC-type glutathione transport system ATPase component